MGYRGKLAEKEEARKLRAQSWKLVDTAKHLGVAKSSVSLWVRDVEFVPSPTRYGARKRPSALHFRKLAEIEECDQWARERLAKLDDHAFLAAGIALYAGEGAKTDGAVSFANTNPAMISFFCKWLRYFFQIDEERFRARIYLHEGLDLQVTETYWSEITQIPVTQFRKPYRALADASIRNTKHEHGCVTVYYSHSKTHRRVMGLVRALLSVTEIPGWRNW